MRIKEFAIGSIAALALAGPAMADIREWDFGDGTNDWFTDANWNTTAPASGDIANIRGFSAAQSPILTSGSTAAMPEMWIGQSNSGFLTINGGIMGPVNTLFVGMYTNAAGTVTQNSGTVTAGDLRLGWDNNSQGTYNLTGGSLSVTSNLALAAGSSVGNQGNFNQSGGTLTGNGAQIANFSNARVATMTLSDSAKTNFSANVEIGLFGSGASSGTLFLDGSKTGDGTNMTASGVTFGAVGTLMISIDDGAILDPLSMRGIDTVNTSFQSGSILDLGFGVGVTPTTGTWTILTADVDISNGGLVLAAGDAAAGWSFDIVNNPSGEDYMTVTYTAVPEPSAMALLGGTGALLLGLRRRKTFR